MEEKTEKIETIEPGSIVTLKDGFEYMVESIHQGRIYQLARTDNLIGSRILLSQREFLYLMGLYTDFKDPFWGNINPDQNNEVEIHIPNHSITDEVVATHIENVTDDVLRHLNFRVIDVNNLN